MKKDSFLDFSNIPLFKGISYTDLYTLLKCTNSKVLRYDRNELIVLEGDSFENIGIVIKGEVFVSRENISGNRLMMTVLSLGGIFGEMAAFSHEKFWPASIQAKEATEILFIPKNSIISECGKMCSFHRTLILNFLRLLSDRALLLNQKVEFLTIKSIRGKISAFLLFQFRKNKSTKFKILLNRNELADFLNVSRPSLSRELAKMKEEQIVDFNLNQFEILKPEKLRD